MAAPAAAPRKPARKAAPPTRAQRNARALANARTAPARRKSGAAKPRTAPAKPRTAPAPSPVARVLNSRGMPLVDRILRGPAWVVMLGVLLAGIVFLNVSVLELNRGIASTDAKSATLERTNSSLRARVAKLDSGERIQQLAATHGFVMPQPGDLTYVRSRPSDARLAVQRMTDPGPPSTTTTAAPPPQPVVQPTATTTPAPTTQAP